MPTSSPERIRPPVSPPGWAEVEQAIARLGSPEAVIAKGHDETTVMAVWNRMEDMVFSAPIKGRPRKTA